MTQSKNPKYILLQLGEKDIKNHTCSVSFLSTLIDSNPPSLYHVLRGGIFTLKMLNKIKKIFRHWNEGEHYQLYAPDIPKTK
jgi:hypothetical protein